MPLKEQWTFPISACRCQCF